MDTDLYSDKWQHWKNLIYYLDHLSRPSYRRYSTVYLCFHGEEGAINFANKESVSLQEIAEDFLGIFSDKKVHFGSCSTLNVPIDMIENFKNITKAKLILLFRA